NQRPKDVCLFNYSPPLYQLSYRRSWRWSGQDLLLCPSHDPKRVFILAAHTVSKTCHKGGLSRWGEVSCFEEILTVSLQMRQVKLEPNSKKPPPWLFVRYLDDLQVANTASLAQ